MDGETYFFIHVMKTAGTSFLFYLNELFTMDGVFPNDRDPVEDKIRIDALRSIPPERRERVRVFTGHFPAFAPEIVGATKTVTILRDPVERAVSMLKQRQRPDNPPSSSLLPRTPDMTLEEIYDDPEIFGPWVHNHQVKVFALDPSDEPESFLHVLDIDQARFDAATERLAAIDVVGFQDDFRRLLRECSEKFGWKRPRVGGWRAFASEPVDVPESLLERIRADNHWDVAFYEHACRTRPERAPAKPARRRPRRQPAPATWGMYRSGTQVDFVAEGVIVAGRDLVGDLRAVGADRDAMRRAVAKAYPDIKPAAAAAWAGVLQRFAFDLRPGDLVVHPRSATSPVSIGRIESDYVFDADASDGRHRRRVTWLATDVPRERFSQGAQEELGSPVVLFEVRRHADEVAAGLDGPEPEPAAGSASLAG